MRTTTLNRTKPVVALSKTFRTIRSSALMLLVLVLMPMPMPMPLVLERERLPALDLSR